MFKQSWATTPVLNPSACLKLSGNARKFAPKLRFGPVQQTPNTTDNFEYEFVIWHFKGVLRSLENGLKRELF